eukprot:gene55950-45327_t
MKARKRALEDGKAAEEMLGTVLQQIKSDRASPGLSPADDGDPFGRTVELVEMTMTSQPSLEQSLLSSPAG